MHPGSESTMGRIRLVFLNFPPPRGQEEVKAESRGREEPCSGGRLLLLASGLENALPWAVSCILVPACASDHSGTSESQWRSRMGQVTSGSCKEGPYCMLLLSWAAVSPADSGGALELCLLALRGPDPLSLRLPIWNVVTTGTVPALRGCDEDGRVECKVINTC